MQTAEYYRFGVCSTLQDNSTLQKCPRDRIIYSFHTLTLNLNFQISDFAFNCLLTNISQLGEFAIQVSTHLDQVLNV